MFNIQIVDPTLYPGWDDLILRHPESTFFHTSAWARVLAESYGYTPLYFTVFENGGISGLIPVMEVKSALTGTRGVSLPFTDFCDPIVNDNTSFKGLFDRVVDFGRRQNWRYIELRGGFESRESQVASRKGVSGLSSFSPCALPLTPNIVYRLLRLADLHRLTRLLMPSIASRSLRRFFLSSLIALRLTPNA